MPWHRVHATQRDPQAATGDSAPRAASSRNRIIARSRETDRETRSSRDVCCRDAPIPMPDCPDRRCDVDALLLPLLSSGREDLVHRTLTVPLGFVRVASSCCCSLRLIIGWPAAHRWDLNLWIFFPLLLFVVLYNN